VYSDNFQKQMCAVPSPSLLPTTEPDGAEMLLAAAAAHSGKRAPALAGAMPVPSLCLGCPRAIEITSRARSQGVFMRVIGEHLPQCSQAAYSRQQPLDVEVKDWFASAIRAGLTPDEALDSFDCHLDLKNQRT